MKTIDYAKANNLLSSGGSASSVGVHRFSNVSDVGSISHNVKQ
jgi:hypothetical protein